MAATSWKLPPSPGIQADSALSVERKVFAAPGWVEAGVAEEANTKTSGIRVACCADDVDGKLPSTTGFCLLACRGRGEDIKASKA